MSNEATLVLGVWEAVRDHIPHPKRAIIAQDIVVAFEEYGFEASDISSIIDEDPSLADAFHEVFPDEEEESEADEL
jgi:hypothetical protein